MSEAIRVEHLNEEAENQLSIEISLGNKCNYACSYCPNELHDGSIGWNSEVSIREFLERADQHYQGMTKLIQYTGGEPTMYPGFKDLLEFGRERGFVHSVITNGSRTERFWSRHAEYFDKIHLTFHQEFADIEHFEKVIRIAHQNARVHVNFTMIVERFDEIMGLASGISDLPNTTITLKPLRVNFGSELYPYTDDQLSAMKEFVQTGELQRSKDLRGMMRVVYDDDTEEVKKPSTFLLDQDNSWYDWNCRIGLQSLVVNPNGDIYRGVCRVGGRLGNLKTSYEFPTNPIRCRRKRCSCPTDIMTQKEKQQ